IGMSWPRLQYAPGLVLLAIVGLAIMEALAANAPASIESGEIEYPHVHIRWKSDSSQTTRSELEKRFGLQAAEQLEGLTFRYEARDTSAATVKAIVEHPLVEDT